MELYILIALLFIYIVTAVIGSSQHTKRIWMMAWVLSFIMLGISLSAVRITNQDVMLNAGQFNWYYFLYIFGALTVALALINMWIYRHNLWNLWSQNTDEITDNKE